MNAHAPLLDDRPSILSPAKEFAKARRAETQYAAQLRKIARHIGDIVKGFHPGDFVGMASLEEALNRYAAALAPWARSVARKMIAEVAARDKLAWARVSAQMGRSLRAEIKSAPIGEAMRGLLGEQVALITSLPLDAAQRVHDLTIEARADGTRASEIAARIFETGEVTRSRANTIARTEVARTSGVLTQARAQHVGSTHYQWLTVGNSDVRPDHKLLNNQIFAWADPPIADRRTGTRAHPGCIYNCRCVSLPIIPEHI